MASSQDGDQAIIAQNFENLGIQTMDRMKNISGGDKATSCPLSRDLSVREFECKAKPRCGLCSRKEIIGYTTKTVFHEHFSTKFLRECCDADEEPKDYPCPSCKTVHSTGYQDRLKICVSSTSLHRFWEKLQYAGDSSHVDYLSIPGATINDLTVAWEIAYANESRPMDVILIGGLTNIVEGHRRSCIMRAYQHFVNLVIWQGRTHPEAPNTCAIGTMFYPPKYCWFPDAGRPPRGFTNRLSDFQEINAEIEDLNATNNVKVPNFPTFGVRKDTKFGRQTTKHRLEHWAGERVTDKIFLVDDQRIKMGKQMVRYLEHTGGQVVYDRNER